MLRQPSTGVPRMCVQDRSRDASSRLAASTTHVIEMTA
jgi:hypothetical protein